MTKLAFRSKKNNEKNFNENSLNNQINDLSKKEYHLWLESIQPKENREDFYHQHSCGWKNWDEDFECLHCGKTFNSKDYKIQMYPGEKHVYLMCAHFPKCSGSLIDWM